MTNSVEETAVIGVAKTASMIALLVAVGVALSACAAQPITQARATVKLPNIYALNLDADVPVQVAGAAVVADRVTRAAQ